MTTPKHSHANKELMDQRVDQVLELMVKRRFSDRKIRNALIQSEGISARTAERYIKKAHQILAGVGSQASAEERGLLWERMDDLYAAEQNSAQPNRGLLNQMIRTHLEIHKTHPNFKGGLIGESASHSTPTLNRA